MSVSNEQINLSNINDLEEGEIFDSNINKQEIIKLIDENKKKNIFTKNESNIIFDPSSNPNDFITSSENQEEAEDDEENQGFFLKMMNQNVEDKKLIGKKRNRTFENDKNSDEDQESLFNNQNISEKINFNFLNPNYKIKNLNNLNAANFPVGTFNSSNYESHQQYNIDQVLNSNMSGKFSKKSKNDQNNKKKMICNFYINGACNKGKDCNFSHEAQQIKKTELCKYFLTNACLKGDECVYSHDTKSYPCKFFHAVGYCEKGENCRFSHVRLNEEDINKFLEENEEFLFEIQKTQGRTNMDDYFVRYLQEKKKLSKEETVECLKLPFQTIIPGSINQSNVQQGKFGLPLATNMLQQKNLLNTNNLKQSKIPKNIPIFNQTNPMFKYNMNLSNANIQNFNNLLYQQQKRLQQSLSSNVLINNMNNLNNPNILQMKNINQNFQNFPIRNMMNGNLAQIAQLGNIPNNTMNILGFQNIGQNLNNLNNMNNLGVGNNSNANKHMMNISNMINRKINPFEKPTLGINNKDQNPDTKIQQASGLNNTNNNQNFPNLLCVKDLLSIAVNNPNLSNLLNSSIIKSSGTQEEVRDNSSISGKDLKNLNEGEVNITNKTKQTYENSPIVSNGNSDEEENSEEERFFLSDKSEIKDQENKSKENDLNNKKNTKNVINTNFSNFIKNEGNSKIKNDLDSNNIIEDNENLKKVLLKLIETGDFKNNQITTQPNQINNVVKDLNLNNPLIQKDLINSLISNYNINQSIPKNINNFQNQSENFKYDTNFIKKDDEKPKDPRRRKKDSK